LDLNVFDSVAGPFIELNGHKMHNLIAVNLSYTMSSDQLVKMLSTSPLQHLSVCKCREMSRKSFFDILRASGSKLQSLSVREVEDDWNDQSESIFDCIADNCPNLEELSVSHLTHSVGLENVAQKCTKLREFSAENEIEVERLRTSASLRRVTVVSHHVSRLVNGAFLTPGTMSAMEWEYSTQQSFSEQIPLRSAIKQLLDISPPGVGLNIASSEYRVGEMTILTAALQYNAPREALDLIVHSGADVHFRTKNDRHTAFYYVSSKSSIEFLLDHGVDPREPCYFDGGAYAPNAFMHFVSHDKLNLFKVMISEDIFPRIVAITGTTHVAEESLLILFLGRLMENDLAECLEVLEYMLQPNIQQMLGISTQDRTPYHTTLGGPTVSYRGLFKDANQLGYTCMHRACQKGVPPKFLRMLVDAGADPFAVGPDGVSTPIVHACSRPKWDRERDSYKYVIEQMLLFYQRKFGDNFELPPLDAKPCPESELNFFMGAWDIGEVNLIKRLMKQLGTNAEQLRQLQASGGVPLLIRACADGLNDDGAIALGMIESGLLQKADINVIAKTGENALLAARKLPHLIPKLLQGGAEITPLVAHSLGAFDAKSIALLLEAGIDKAIFLDPIAQGKLIQSCVDSMAPLESLKIIWEMLPEENRVSALNAKTEQLEETLLHLLSNNKQAHKWANVLPCVLWAIEHGADIKAKNCHSVTAGGILESVSRFSNDGMSSEDSQALQELEKALQTDEDGGGKSASGGGLFGSKKQGGVISAAELESWFAQHVPAQGDAKPIM
jgi:hypothetical protein